MAAQLAASQEVLSSVSKSSLKLVIKLSELQYLHINYSIDMSLLLKIQKR
jgi:hypothetical protein